MGDQRHKRAYPSGERFQMTPEWKALVRAELSRRDAGGDPPWRGRAQIALAEALDVDKSTITKLLQRQTASALVPRICDVLELPMPVHGTPTEVAELVAKLERNPDSMRILVEFLRRLVRGL